MGVEAITDRVFLNLYHGFSGRASLCVHMAASLPLLPQYAERKRTSMPSTGMRMPVNLVRELATNNLDASETITDGNCGVHAFGLSLARAAAKNQAWRVRNKLVNYRELFF